MRCAHLKCTLSTIYSSRWTTNALHLPSVAHGKLLDAATKTKLTDRILSMLEERAKQYASHFIVRTGTRIQIVLVEDTEWIAAAGDYTELHAHDRSHLLRESMNSLEKKLDPARFLRIHRSRIVQSRCITELRSIENGEYLVKLSDGSRAPLEPHVREVGSSVGCTLKRTRFVTEGLLDSKEGVLGRSRHNGAFRASGVPPAE